MKKNLSDLYQIKLENLSEPSPFPVEHQVDIESKDTIKKDALKPVHILVDKVYDSCQQRDCFEKFRIKLPTINGNYEFLGTTFQEGTIEKNTLKVMPIGCKKPDYSRIQFTLNIPFTIGIQNVTSNEMVYMNGVLPPVHKDIVLFMPQARNEFNFRIVVESRSEVLAPVKIKDGQLEMTIGVLSVVRVVGRIELSVPTYASIHEPKQAENFKDTDENIREQYVHQDFPQDFFPDASKKEA